MENDEQTNQHIDTYSKLALGIIEIKTNLFNGWTLSFRTSDSSMFHLAKLVDGQHTTVEEILLEILTFANDVTVAANLFGLPQPNDTYVTEFDDHFIITDREFYVDDQIILIGFEYHEDLSAHLDDEDDDEQEDEDEDNENQ